MSPGIPIIHVIDDDASFRTGVARLLRASGYDVALYDTAAQFLDNQPGDRPGCILLDVRMPELSGPEAQARLIEAGNPLPIIFLTGHGDLPTSVRAIKQGAEDFLSKPAPGTVLVEAIERALARYDENHERQLRLRAMHAAVARLTPRERQVFALVVRSKLNKPIAHELGTSERTVKAHRHAMMDKLGVPSLAQAVSIADALGILSPAG